MDDVFYKYEENQYNNGILLNDYNNEFSLVSASQKDDQTYMDWVFPQKKDGSKKPIDKALPWKIKLGEKQEAIKILKFFIDALEGNASDSDGQPDFNFGNNEPKGNGAPEYSTEDYDQSEIDIPF